MIDINDYSKECECIYKERTYKVRDNGAIMRLPKSGSRASKLDNQWTFGNKDNKTGYMIYGGERVHIIVATAFHGSQNSKVFVVDHIDTNRCNNRPENLRWLTRLDNVLLNPITCHKIEAICGSVEVFLKNPRILDGRTGGDYCLEWMRNVTPEEAENSLAHWNKWVAEGVVNSNEHKAIGEWIYKPIKPSSVPITTIENPFEVPEPEIVATPITIPEKATKTKKTSRKKKKAFGIHSLDSIQIRAIDVYFINTECWKCGKDMTVYFIRNLYDVNDKRIAYLDDYFESDFNEDICFMSQVISSIQDYASKHPEKNIHLGEIKPRYSGMVDDPYMSFGCPSCDILFGDFYVTEFVAELIYDENPEHLSHIEFDEPLILTVNKE